MTQVFTRLRDRREAMKEFEMVRAIAPVRSDFVQCTPGVCIHGSRKRILAR